MTATRTLTGTILLVDDMDGIRLAFASWLRRAGHTVIEASTGAAALEAVAQNNIDLVVLDIHLPDISGGEVRDRIKSSRATASIPILHVSGTATDASDRSLALSEGADGYLFEPVERDELVATVAALLRYHDARRTAERLAQRLERLHEATLLMSAASGLTELLQFACNGLVSVFGAPATLALAVNGLGRLTFGAPNHPDPVVTNCPIDDVSELARQVGAGQAPKIAPLVPEAEALSVVPMASSIASPRGEQVGVALVFTQQPAPDDLLMLDHFTQALAVSLEKQRLYDVEHKIALTLQKAMLPATIPQLDFLQVAVRYQAASETAQIGGDFYEAVAMDDDRMLLAVGDVVGHSLQAATVMAELRHSLRALAGIGMSAGDIMDRLNRTLQESHAGMTATVCIVEVHRDGTVEITNAGHIPPVIRDTAGVRQVTTHGPLLGFRTASSVPTERATVAPGGVIVLATDGLIERRHEDLRLGLDRLIKSVTNADSDPERASDGILAELTHGEALSDDVALVVARKLL